MVITFTFETYPRRNESLWQISGVSMSKQELTSEDKDTERVSRRSATVITASGFVESSEEATVSVKDLDMFVTKPILHDAPAALS